MKSVADLWDIYCTSVGRNSVLLLNIPPDRRGRFCPIDSANVVSLRKGIDETFARNILAGSKIKATNIRGKKYDPKYLIDDNPSTYYAGKDGDVTADITFTLPEASVFDCLMLREVIRLGHRTTRWCVDYSDDNKNWTTIPETEALQSVGNKWIVRFEPIKARYVRLRILDGNAAPALNTFGLYRQSGIFRR